MPLKVAIIGPESTGKSTLCEHLSQHYNALWVPEYAREYLQQHGTKYTYDDLLIIAQRQMEAEDAFVNQSNSQVLFIDTNMYVMKVWCEFVYGKCHQYIIDEIATRHYDLYLLCNIDLEWEYQEMREYPDLESRTRLFHMYKDILINQHTPWKMIEGSSELRTRAAVDTVNALLNAKV